MGKSALWAITLSLSIGAGVFAGERTSEPRHIYPTPETSVQTVNNPDPIFRCSGAGVGVVVSLGGDGSSVYVYCDSVKH